MIEEQWHDPTPDELTAGRIWFAIRELNTMMLEAAREGVHTQVIATRTTDSEKQITATQLYGQCYRREDILAIRVITGTDPTGSMEGQSEAQQERETRPAPPPEGMVGMSKEFDTGRRA